MVRRYGRDAVSFQTLTSDAQLWFCDDACVAYTEVGGVWVTVGGPVAPPERVLEVAESFARHARARGKRVRFFGMETPIDDASTLAHIQIGEQPVWDVARWPKGLPKKLRYKLRRAHSEGLVVVREATTNEIEDAASPVRCGIDRVVDSWLASRRMAPMGFLVRLNPYARAAERRFFVAEQDGRVVGAIIAMPVYGRNGWTFETFLRDPSAPFFTMELLFDRALRTFAAEGSAYVTYGLCPLSGSPSQLFAAIRRTGDTLYGFDGLRRFKGKLKPDSWHPVYLAYPRSDHALWALTDALRAFLPGGFARFAWRTLVRRGRALITRGLVPQVSSLELEEDYDGPSRPQGAKSVNAAYAPARAVTLPVTDAATLPLL